MIRFTANIYTGVYDTERFDTTSTARAFVIDAGLSALAHRALLAVRTIIVLIHSPVAIVVDGITGLAFGGWDRAFCVFALDAFSDTFTAFTGASER